VSALNQFNLGVSTILAPTGFVQEFIPEWDYDALVLSDSQTDGSGVLRGNYPCVDADQGNGCAAPVSEADAMQKLQAYWNARVASLPTNASITSTDGHFFFQHYAAEWGAKMVVSEVGENINSTQAHIAFTRGAGRQFAIPWGMDMSSWYGPSILDYSSPPTWGADSYPTGGHSVSLTERTYFASYLGGANYFQDEAGSVNYFSNDSLPLTLSPMGEMAQNFLEYTQTYPDRGTPFVPFAIIMDAEQSMGLDWWADNTEWETFPIDTSRNFAKNLYLALWPTSFYVQGGNESQYMVPTPYGDSFDVLLENAPTSLFANYRAIIATGHLANNPNLISSLATFVNGGGILVLESTSYTEPFIIGTTNGATEEPVNSLSPSDVTQYHVGSGLVVVVKQSYDWDNALSYVYPNIAPFTINGTIEYSFNRLSDADHWMVTLINDLGVTKAFTTAAVIDPTQAQTVTIETASGAALTQVTNRRSSVCTTATQGSADQFTTTVPSGEVCVFDFYTSGIAYP
jgi:hypothetical protein